jgi:hypothetical protein
MLLGVWDSLRPVAPFGFRVLDEVNAYVLAAQEIGTDWRTAFDEQLVQKVLPRVRGDESAGAAIDAFIRTIGASYPLALAKAERMRRELDDHGFLAFF